ncbi:MAG: hypothetical protein D6680_08075 [Cyanobacteria bacterium J007]|nr:MAG: hypothetical protein D6680_08075 [Cyanobacteria bacterium J007]
MLFVIEKFKARFSIQSNFKSRQSNELLGFRFKSIDLNGWSERSKPTFNHTVSIGGETGWLHGGIKAREDNNGKGSLSLSRVLIFSVFWKFGERAMTE